MIYSQHVKTVVLVPPGTLATNATATARVDTLGYDYATFTVIQGNAAGTNVSAKWASLSLSAGDTTNATSSTTLTDFVGSTNTAVTSGFVIQPNNNTSGGLVHEFQVDCRGKPRYLFFNGQPHATNNTVAVLCKLSRAEQAPVTDAQRGVALTVVG